MTATKTLRLLAVDVRKVNTENGWHDDTRTKDEDAALLHSEVSEALEAYRDHGFEDMTAPFEVSPERRGYPPKPEGVGSELADILIRLLDAMDRQGRQPWWWDMSLADVRPDTTPIASFVGLLAHLHRLIANDYPGDLLPALKATALAAGVDLEFEYDRKILHNRTRGHRHGGKRL